MFLARLKIYVLLSYLDYSKEILSMYAEISNLSNLQAGGRH
jgi:hypothetical protein